MAKNTKKKPAGKPMRGTMSYQPPSKTPPSQGAGKATESGFGKRSTGRRGKTSMRGR
jgi:hypothetical protein